MDNEKIKIYVWPDNSWVSEEDVEDLDWYISSSGKSDDYAEYMVHIDLEPDDIEELIELQALEGMLPDKEKELDIYEMGEIKLDDDAVLIINHPKDIADYHITQLDGKIIINSPGLSFSVLKGGK